MYIIKIRYSVDGVWQDVVYEKESIPLEELKQSFLKRFGNLRGKVTNKLAREYDFVRGITYRAESIREWTAEINSLTSWRLVITVDEGNGFDSIYR